MRTFSDVLKRPVHRKHHAVNPHYRNRVHERSRIEIARRCEVKVLAKVMRHTVLGGILVRSLHPTVAVVDAPKVDGNAFTDMTKYDLQIRAFIEQAATG